ncbi:MAG: hypothetical protein ACFB00_01275 [Parvularculaceae bacterium]
MRRIAMSFAIAALAGAAQAQDLPAPVDAALDEAEALAETRVSYTMTFEWENEPPVVARYDAPADDWTIVEGDPEALSGAGPKKFRTWSRVESEPGGLLYADYRPHLRNVTRLEETDATTVYEFTSPQTPDDLDEVREKLETRLVVDNEDGRLATYAIRALEPFKPNVASKLSEFEFVQNFERPAPGAPALMTYVKWRAKGRRVFSDVDESYVVRFDDFEFMDGAATDEEEAR